MAASEKAAAASFPNILDRLGYNMYRAQVYPRSYVVVMTLY